MTDGGSTGPTSTNTWHLAFYIQPDKATARWLAQRAPDTRMGRRVHGQRRRTGVPRLLATWPWIIFRSSWHPTNDGRCASDSGQTSRAAGCDAVWAHRSLLNDTLTANGPGGMALRINTFEPTTGANAIVRKDWVVLRAQSNQRVSSGQGLGSRGRHHS